MAGKVGNKMSNKIRTKISSDGTAASAVGKKNKENEEHMQKPSHHHHYEKTIIKAFVYVGVVVVLGILMAYYAFRMLSPGPDEKAGVKYYNGFEFVKSGNFWFTEWKRADGTEYSLEFRNSPWDVEGIKVVGSVDERFSKWPYVFITHDPTDETTRATSFVALAASNLASVLTNVFERDVIGACAENVTEACATRPVATCSTNASIIYLKVSNETGVFLDGNCATIQGYEEGLTKAADKAIYQWLGIIMK